MPYGKEDTDYRTEDDASSGYIFNAADSVFWCRIRDLCGSQLKALYQQLDSENCWSDTGLIAEFDEWQSQFPEEIWRLDTERKYYRTYTGQSVDSSLTGTPTPRFLSSMMNGRKKYQRRQFERDQAIYMGTKFLSTTVTSDQIMFRCNTPVQATIAPDYTLTIIPYSDMYLSVKFGNLSTVAQVRAKAGETYSIPCPLETMDDTAILIYGASRIQALNDLSTCYIHDNDFSKATKIQTLIVGRATNGYSNPFLTTLNIGANKLLENLDIRNCPNLTGSLNLGGCGNLVTLRAEGTALTGVTFATNGKITSAYLPDTIASISMSNLKYLSTLSMDYEGLETVIIENSIVDSEEIVSGGQDTIETLRLVGIDWDISNINLLEAMYAMSNTYISGNIHISGSISSRYLQKYNAKWSDLVITYDTFIQEYAVTFVNDDGSILDVQWIERGGRGENPITRDDNPIPTPTKASTVDTVFTYSAWDSNAYLSAVCGDLTITATYTSAVRTYTIRWYVDGVLKQTSTAPYGDGAEYTGDTPVKADDPDHDIYYLWAGWDKNFYRIYGDTDVNAVFAQGITPAAPDPNNKPPLSSRSIEEINAICKSGQKDWERVFQDGTPSSFEQQYFEVGDEIDVTTGWEPEDDESNSHLIFDLASSPCKLHYNTTYDDAGVSANGVTLPITLNQNSPDPDDEDGDPMYIDTLIPLMYNGGVSFGEDDDYAFTWVLDFAVNDTKIYGDTTPSEPNILNCLATNDGYDHGFKVYAASNGGCSLKYAASSMTVASSRSIGSGSYLVTDPVAHTYVTTTAAMNQSFLERIVVRKKKGERGVTVYRCQPTSTTYATSTLSYTGNTRIAHDRTVLLGCGRSAYGSPSNAMLANCTIYNFKVWDVAMSDTEMAKMSIAPKETLKYRLMTYPRTVYGAAASYNYMERMGTPTAQNPNPASIYPGIALGSTNLMRNYRTMNSTNTNVGGWNGCAMRTWMSDRLTKALPQKLLSAIKTVNVRASAGGGASTPPDSAYEILTSRDKLFLWSTREYGGYSGSPYTDEGTQISLYTNNGSRMKYHQFGHIMIYYYYWCRSPYLRSAADFCGVYSNGYCTGGNANGSYGVAPGFCI